MRSPPCSRHLIVRLSVGDTPTCRACPQLPVHPVNDAGSWTVSTEMHCCGRVQHDSRSRRPRDPIVDWTAPNKNGTENFRMTVTQQSGRSEPVNWADIPRGLRWLTEVIRFCRESDACATRRSQHRSAGYGAFRTLGTRQARPTGTGHQSHGGVQVADDGGQPDGGLISLACHPPRAVV